MRYHYEGQGLDWFELVNFIDQLDAQIAIDSLDIRSRGNLTHSIFAQAEVTVAVTSETTRRQAATTFPALEGPVRTGRSKRFFTTPTFPFAGQFCFPAAASGPDFAPSRPDPPTFRRFECIHLNFNHTNSSFLMITLNFLVPETADEINKRFNHTGTSIDAKALMGFTLPGHDLAFQSPKAKTIQYAEGAGLGQSQECSQCRWGRFSHLTKVTNHPVFIAQ